MAHNWIGATLCLAGLAFHQARAQIVFSNGFEGSAQEVTDAWGSANAANWRIADPGPFNTPGNRVLKLTIPAGQMGATMLVKTVAGYDRLYARWYMKFPDGYNFNDDARHGSWFGVGTIGKAGNIPSADNSFYYSVEPSNQGKMYIYAYYAGMACSNPPPPGPTCWGSIFQDAGRPAVTIGKWFCLEIMINAGTPTPSATGANGEFDLWVDSLRIGPWGGLWLRSIASLKTNTLRLEIYNEPALTHDLSVLYDDVVMSQQRIGPVGGPGDTAVPAAPNNLKATAVSASQINLTWKDNSYNEKMFIMEKKVSPTGAWTKFDTTQTNISSGTSSGLGPSHTFYYRVLALGNNGKSGYSNVDSATTLSTGMQMVPTSRALGNIRSRWVFAPGGAGNKLSFVKEAGVLEVYNIAGRKVWQHRHTGAYGDTRPVYLPADLEGILYLKFE